MSELSVGQLKGLTVNTNKITVPSGHTLYAPGHTIQTLSATKVDGFTTTSTSYVDVAGLSLSITPLSSNSKILVTVSMNIANSASAWSFVQLYRGASPIHVSTAGGNNATYAGNLASATSAEMIPLTISYLDSPNTISTTAYKIMVKGNDVGSTTSINRRATDTNLGAVSSITLMEIAQ